MATNAQIQANRENAKKSTGPVTPEGKAASSRNNFRYGFRGAFRVYAGESQEPFDALFNDLREEHQPATPTEQILVERMAQHHWLAQRAQFLFNTHPGDLQIDRLIPELSLWLRYQTSNERAFHKCLTELRKLKAERKKAQRAEDSSDEAASCQRAEDSSDEAASCQRAEDSKNGFERQERKQAAGSEPRPKEAGPIKQAMHEAKTVLAAEKQNNLPQAA